MKKRRVYMIIALLFLTYVSWFVNKYIEDKLYHPADYKTVDHSTDFSSVQTFVLFIGYPRSGSTLVGALMDAHPNMVIANEYNLLQRSFNPSKTNRTALLKKLLEESIKESFSGQRSPNRDSFFNYNVPGLWQGRSNGTILIIGDKKAAATSQCFLSHRHTFQNIVDIVKLPVKFIHVIRNPFDTIATMVLREVHMRWELKRVNQKRIDTAVIEKNIQTYFGLAYNNTKIRKLFPGQILDIYYAQMLSKPKNTLTTICNFMQVPCDHDYLEKAASVVNKHSTFTRQYIPWSKKQKAKIQHHINNIYFFNGFKFEL